MITPAFRLEQTDDEVVVHITAPHLDLNAVDFAIDGTQFKFVAHPYFLRLRLPGEVVEDGRESCRYDTDTGMIIAKLPKAVPGEHFEGLDLLTTLLARKAPPRASGPLIEVLADVPSDDSAAAAAVNTPGDEDGWEWETEQAFVDHDNSQDASPGLGVKPGYGFALRYSGTLGPICREVPDVVELPDPDGIPVADRAAIRIAAEDAKFETEAYACDYDESRSDPDAPVNAILAFTPAWREWCQEGGPVRFSEVESEQMRGLPRKEFIVDSVKPELIGLVDIVYGWAYDHRTTMGDHTVESAWTVCALSATLSFLARHRTVYEAVVACVRRAVAYPLYRVWTLAEAVLDDTRAIFRMGKRAVLKCLLDARSLLIHDEVKRYLADIYLTDYCVWLQSIPDAAVAALSRKLDAIEITRDDVGWPLAQIEAIVDAPDDPDAPDSDDEASEDDGDDSSDDDGSSDGSDTENETDATPFSEENGHGGDGMDVGPSKPSNTDGVGGGPGGGEGRHDNGDDSDAIAESFAAIAISDSSTRSSEHGESESLSLDVAVTSHGAASVQADTEGSSTAVVPWRFDNPWVDTRALQTRDMTFCGELVVIEQDLSAEIDVTKNTGLILWDASFVLARFLERRVGHMHLAGKRVLELGAGTGLPSVVAALLGASVTATDLDEALPLLTRNVDAAIARARARVVAPCVGAAGPAGVTAVAEGDVSETMSVAGTSAQVSAPPRVASLAPEDLNLKAERLVWSADATHTSAPFDVVLCSEVVYDETAHAALFDCLHALCVPGTEVFFVFKKRGLGEGAFVHRLSASLRFQVITVPQDELEHGFQGVGIELLRAVVV